MKFYKCSKENKKRLSQISIYLKKNKQRIHEEQSGITIIYLSNMHKNALHLLVFFFLFAFYLFSFSDVVQLAWAVEYTDCISAEG